MSMKKKIIISVVALVCIVAIVIGVLTYNDFEYRSMALKGKDLYIEIISFSYSKLGIHQEKYEYEFLHKYKYFTDDIVDKYESGEYVTPIDVRNSIENKFGETLITIYGYVTTKDGERLEINHQLTVGCVFTRDIPVVFQPQLKNN